MDDEPEMLVLAELIRQDDSCEQVQTTSNLDEALGLNESLCPDAGVTNFGSGTRTSAGVRACTRKCQSRGACCV